MRLATIITVILVAYGSLAAAEDMGATARGMFALLPESIFETTPEGLGEGEKQALLINGRSEYWEIAEESPDEMVFVSLPLRERAIGVRVFRNEEDGSATVALGSIGDPVCALELWRMDMVGRAVPVDTPPEPGAREFFDKRRKLPKNIRHSVLICLERDGLAARPLFWNLSGMVRARPDKRIRFAWTGRNFEKKVEPLGRKATP